MTYDRSTIEAMPPRQRPHVRCEFPRIDIDEDGRRSNPYPVRREGNIVVDGNNPWVVVHAGGSTREVRVSWGLLCEVLNDPYATPIDGFQSVEYEV